MIDCFIDYWLTKLLYTPVYTTPPVKPFGALKTVSPGVLYSRGVIHSSVYPGDRVGVHFGILIKLITEVVILLGGVIECTWYVITVVVEELGCQTPSRKGV